MKTNLDLMKNYLSDSSCEIWKEYFEPFYRKSGWSFWNTFDYPEPDVKKKRLYAKCCRESKEYGNVFLNCQLGGEMDFNFNSCPEPKKWYKRKYEYYNELIRNDDKMLKEDKAKAYELLKECKERQYRCCNLSIFITTGGLNNLKGKMSQDQRALDRFDVFIFVLNDYFVKRNNHLKDGQKEDYMHIIFSEAWHGAIENRKILFEYLNLYRDIVDYFIKNYSINDKKLIADLIESGSKPINTGERVVEYLRLAKQYWNAKENAIKKIILQEE